MPRPHDGDTTRRRILRAGLAAVGGVIALGPAQAADNDPADASPPAPVKLTPEAVHYQPAPNDWQKCLFCAYFKEPDTCAIVSGAVSRQGWCDHFALLHE